MGLSKNRGYCTPKLSLLYHGIFGYPLSRQIQVMRFSLSLEFPGLFPWEGNQRHSKLLIYWDPKLTYAADWQVLHNEKLILLWVATLSFNLQRPQRLLGPCIGRWSTPKLRKLVQNDKPVFIWLRALALELGRYIRYPSQHCRDWWKSG